MGGGGRNGPAWKGGSGFLVRRRPVLSGCALHHPFDGSHVLHVHGVEVLHPRGRSRFLVKWRGPFIQRLGAPSCVALSVPAERASFLGTNLLWRNATKTVLVQVKQCGSSCLLLWNTAKNSAVSSCYLACENPLLNRLFGRFITATLFRSVTSVSLGVRHAKTKRGEVVPCQLGRMHS